MKRKHMFLMRVFKAVWSMKLGMFVILLTHRLSLENSIQQEEFVESVKLPLKYWLKVIAHLYSCSTSHLHVMVVKLSLIWP